MYYTLHARLKKTEPDYKSDLNLFQTDPVQHDSDQSRRTVRILSSEWFPGIGTMPLGVRITTRANDLGSNGSSKN